ncbi:MAG: DUF4177 domain-containing protein [Spirosomataceae bacterium]
MPTYEYKVLEVKPVGFGGTVLTPETIETQRNTLAREGWELVDSLGTNHYESGASQLMFIFKHPTTRS